VGAEAIPVERGTEKFGAAFPQLADAVVDANAVRPIDRASTYSKRLVAKMCDFPPRPNEMTVDQRKRELILRLFVSPADEDFLSARWCYRMGLFQHFYWSAAQALEKYMKACLLANGDTADVGHDLRKLHEAVLGLDATGILPQKITLPETTGMGAEMWATRDMAEFVQYLSSYGDPDNRYGLIGIRVVGPDIHVLDMLCLSLRRLLHRIGIRPRCSEYSEDWHVSCDGLLERASTGRKWASENRELGSEFKNMNIAFFENHSSDESTFGGQHYSASPLYVHLVKIAEMYPTTENISAVEELRAWVKVNIRMGKRTATALKLR
jgi:HEPN domain